MTNEKIILLMEQIYETQTGKRKKIEINENLRDINFRSLDFAELCLRVEEEIGNELNFDAAQLRKIERVSDVCKFLIDATNE